MPATSALRAFKPHSVSAARRSPSSSESCFSPRHATTDPHRKLARGEVATVASCPHAWDEPIDSVADVEALAWRRPGLILDVTPRSAGRLSHSRVRATALNGQGKGGRRIRAQGAPYESECGGARYLVGHADKAGLGGRP